MTTVELVVGTFILAAGLIPVLGTMIQTSRQAGFTTRHALAALRAQSLLDHVSARGLEELMAAHDRGETLHPGPAAGGEPGGPIEATGEEVSFEAVSPRLGKLTVDVAWRIPGKPGTHRTRCFRLLARPDHSWSHSHPLPLAGAAIAD